MKKYIAILCLCAAVLGLTLAGRTPQTGGTTPPAVTQPDPPVSQVPDPQPETPPVQPDPQPTPEPQQDPEAIPFFDCGTLDIPNDAPMTGRENFAEFINLTGVGKQARIHLTYHSPANDLLPCTLLFDGQTYTLVTDNTADQTIDASERVKKTTIWRHLIVQEIQEDNGLYQLFRLTNLDSDRVAGTDLDSDDLYTLFGEPIE